MSQARIDKTHDKMRRGGLPRPRDDSAKQTWFGPGYGVSCTGCGDTIDKTETQCDVDFVEALTFKFHRECFEHG